MQSYPTTRTSDLDERLLTGQAALDDLKRKLRAEAAEELSKYARSRRSRSAPPRPRASVKLGAVVMTAALIGIVGVGGYVWKQQSDDQALQVARAQVIMNSPECEKVYRSKGVVSEETDICLAAAHLVEGR